MRLNFRTCFERYLNHILAALFCTFTAFVLYILIAGANTPSVILQRESAPVFNESWFYFDSYRFEVPVATLPTKIPTTKHCATLYHRVVADSTSPLFLCFLSQHQSVTVTVDGEPIYRYENVPKPAWLKTYRAFYHIVQLPANLAKGALLGIEIKTHIAEYDGTFSPIFLGPRAAIFQELIHERWRSFTLGIAMLIASLFLLGTSFLFLRGIKDFTLLHLALLTFCIGLWQLEESRLLQFFFGYQPLHWTFEYATQLFMPLLTFLFLQSINNKRVSTVTIFNFWLIVAVLLIQLFLQLTGLAALTSTIFFSHILYALMCLHSLTVLVRQPWLKHSNLRYLFGLTMIGAVGIFTYTFVALLYGHFYSTALSIGLALAFLSMILLTYHKELQFFQQASQTEAYRELAFIDMATGAHNKTAWFTLIDTFNEQSPQGEYGLILFDMNNLKKLNDQWGHLIGDRVIKAFAYCLIEAADKRGTIYRIGGDEFVCICYGDPREKVATIISEFDKIVEYQKYSDHPFSAAYGFTFFTPKTPHDFQVAVDTADAKMYRNKQEMKQSRALAENATPDNSDEILEELPAVSQ